MARFHVQNVQGHHRDVQRDWLFEVVIPEISRVVPTANIDPEGLRARARTVTLPGDMITEIESNYMGTKQFFAGKRNYASNEFSVQFEETEDIPIWRTFKTWMDSIMGIDPALPNAGVALPNFAQKRGGYSTDIFVTTFSYNGMQPLQVVQFKNAWVKSVPDMSLAMANEGKIEYDITFQFDYYRRIKG